MKKTILCAILFLVNMPLVAMHFAKNQFASPEQVAMLFAVYENDLPCEGKKSVISCDGKTVVGNVPTDFISFWAERNICIHVAKAEVLDGSSKDISQEIPFTRINGVMNHLVPAAGVESLSVFHSLKTSGCSALD